MKDIPELIVHPSALPDYLPAEVKAEAQPIPATFDKTTHGNTVFVVDDIAYSPNMPRPTHWSVGWADLMMTMFILFLAMYAYEVANQEFLSKGKKEIVGGDTTEALQSLDAGRATLPFSPIKPGVPMITAGKIKQVEKVGMEAVRQQDAALTETVKKPGKKLESGAGKVKPGEKQDPEPAEKIAITPGKIALIVPGEKPAETLPVPPVPLPGEEVVGPNPIIPGTGQAPPGDRFQEIYTLGKDALEENKLGKFAAIDIVPDKTVRIVLTGDLLFNTGESELSGSARESLQKITAVIRHTPYMINVVGHTDNIPMRSTRFKSNWELSVARASTVARYLIEEEGMEANQFVVSGYSSYRPVAPNTTAENRAQNRRVEIIISKRLPDPLPATAENLR